MNNNNFFSKTNIKKLFTYSTIAILSVCALIGIITIFVGPTTTLLALLSTIFIFYIVAALSLPSIRRLDDRSMLIRMFSITALIMNAFWAIPWTLLVWDVFGNFDLYTRDVIWRLLWTAADIAIFCTVVAARLVSIRWSSRLKKFFQSLPLICAGFLAFDILLVIWVTDGGDELVFKFACAEIILIVLQVVVTQLLSQKMRQEEAHERMIQEARSKREHSQSGATSAEASPTEATKKQEQPVEADHHDSKGEKPAENHDNATDPS